MSYWSTEYGQLPELDGKNNIKLLSVAGPQSTAVSLGKQRHSIFITYWSPEIMTHWVPQTPSIWRTVCFMAPKVNRTFVELSGNELVVIVGDASKSNASPV